MSAVPRTTTECPSDSTLKAAIDEQLAGIVDTIRHGMLQDALRHQADLCEEQSQRLVIPQIVQPLAEAIATR